MASDPKLTAAIDHREELLDEALEETFPASDPISPSPGTFEPPLVSGDRHDL